MMKGYLTIYLSLSLSLLIGFVLLLTGGSIRNGERVRFESGVDIGMNATLSEYCAGLFKKYDLLYIDTSYLGKTPSCENLQERLWYYLEENVDPPWGRVRIDDVEIKSIETAAAKDGASMRSQAVAYILDQGEPMDRQWKVLEEMDEIRSLEARDPMSRWHALMGQISEMELPKIQNQEGQWEEVYLSNPADVIYGMSGCDVLYLANLEFKEIGTVSIRLSDYISHRQIVNTESTDREYMDNDGAFLAYLYEKMGYLKNPADDGVLSYQLEYVACGKASDWENVRAVWERLFRWRFADNLSCALEDGNLRSQAAVVADLLQVVQMNGAFREPVIQSILYACAFLESVDDIRVLHRGGEVPVKKSSLGISVADALSGNTGKSASGGGLSYKEYLAGMLLLLEKDVLNLRAMDIMEMEMRIYDNNPNFAMDWCVERYLARICARSNYGDVWVINRRYGYY